MNHTNRNTTTTFSSSSPSSSSLLSSSPSLVPIIVTPSEPTPVTVFVVALSSSPYSTPSTSPTEIEEVISNETYNDVNSTSPTSTTTPTKTPITLVPISLSHSIYHHTGNHSTSRRNFMSVVELFIRLSTDNNQPKAII
jgi:hypothetical protein